MRRPLRRLRLVHDAEGQPVRLSEGGLSVIFLGRAHFEGGGCRRVAVKRTRHPIGEREALRLERCIADLTQAGVGLPPMCVHPLSGNEWAVVSPLFGSRDGGSKLSQRSLFFRDISHTARCHAVIDLTRVANAGYTPALDLFLFLQRAPNELIPMDLDLILRAPEPSCNRALLRCVAQISDSPSERRELLKRTVRHATGSLRHELWQSLCDPNSPFRPYWEG